MLNRVLVAAAVSTLALVACSSDVQGPTGGGSHATGGSSSGSTSSTGGASSSSGSSGTTSGGTSGTTSGGTSGTGSSSGNPVNTETWNDGKQITANVDIVAGATVTIAPGAHITVTPGVAITVHGTLTASSKATHAKLTSTAAWGGIIVASGGSMTLTGVDLDNAGVTANGNDLAAQYDYGTITSGLFTVDVGGKLSTDHAAVVTGGATSVNGAFTATFLDYSGSEISMGDPSATVSVIDSKITGSGGDFFTPGSGKLLHISYSTIDKTHCPIHMSGIAKFELDHITTGGTGATSTSGFGLMVYNGDVGPHTVSYSNFNDPNWDQTVRTAVINIDHSYFKVAPATVGQVTTTAKQTTMITDAHPRGTPGPLG
jgi:hypothetical protein